MATFQNPTSIEIRIEINRTETFAKYSLYAFLRYPDGSYQEVAGHTHPDLSDSLFFRKYGSSALLETALGILEDDLSLWESTCQPCRLSCDDQDIHLTFTTTERF